MQPGRRFSLVSDDLKCFGSMRMFLVLVVTVLLTPNGWNVNWKCHSWNKLEYKDLGSPLAFQAQNFAAAAYAKGCHGRPTETRQNEVRCSQPKVPKGNDYLTGHSVSRTNATLQWLKGENEQSPSPLLDTPICCPRKHVEVHFPDPKMELKHFHRDDWLNC